MFSRDGWLRKCCSQNTGMYSAEQKRVVILCSHVPTIQKVNCCAPFTPVALARAERDAVFLFAHWISESLNPFALSAAVPPFGK